MHFETGSLTEEQKIELEITREVKLCNSKLKGMNQLGIAPRGELTTLLGPKGNGKSAMIKTIICEASSQNVKVLTVLSEERVLSYKKGISDVFAELKKIDWSKNYEKYLENCLYTSIISWDPPDRNLNFLKKLIRKAVKEHNVELVLFDNYTTSFLGNANVSAQGGSISDLRDLASELDISLLAVYHTAKGSNPYTKILDGEDVRGNATSTNTAANNYVLTTFFELDPPRSFLHIDKARYHPAVNKTFWELRYDKDLGIFIQDVKTDAKKIRAITSELKKINVHPDTSVVW